MVSGLPANHQKKTFIQLNTCTCIHKRQLCLEVDIKNWLEEDGAYSIFSLKMLTYSKVQVAYVIRLNYFLLINFFYYIITKDLLFNNLK